jgi:hypothetical protein
MAGLRICLCAPLSLAYLQGLLSGWERKNGWQLAEWMEEAAPYRVQHLLDRARWDADAARDKLRHYVVEELSSPDAVLIVDETGFLKKGLHSAGVKRQYSGTGGRIENSQVGVFLCYGSDPGAALVDRELYLPQEWAEDPERRREAAIPETVEFATKPELARQMIERALDAGAPCGWVAADEVYGHDSQLRRFLEGRQMAYVLAWLPTSACGKRIVCNLGWMQLRGVCPHLHGSAFPPVSAARANGSMIGRCCNCRNRMVGLGRFWCGAASKRSQSALTIWVTLPSGKTRLQRWSEWLDNAG